MRRLHIAIAVADIETSVKDYSTRFGYEPVLVVPDEYALWRMPGLNMSIRKSKEGIGIVRHLGWEDDDAPEFTTDIDINGIFWETFSAAQQAEEIRKAWPDVDYRPET